MGILFLLIGVIAAIVIVGFLAFYNYVSWGIVTYFFINWFLVSVLNENFGMNVTDITFIQGIGLYFIITLFLNKKVKQDDIADSKKLENSYANIKEYKNELNEIVSYRSRGLIDHETYKVQKEDIENKLRKAKDIITHFFVNLLSPWISLLIGWVFYSWFF